MKKIYAICLIVLMGLFPNSSKASHILGMDMEYEHLGNGVYQVWVSMYRDCQGIPAPSTLNLEAFTPNGCTPFSSTQPVIATLSQQCLYPGSHLPNGATCEVTNMCSGIVPNSCCSSTAPTCVTGVGMSTYTGIITLPAGTGNIRCTEWIFAASNCTRNPSITNLSNPGNQCTYVYAEINDSLQNASFNSSPQWTQRNQWISGVGQIVDLDFSCIDPDGDSLVYRLVPAYQDWNTPVTYNAGFTFLQPFLVTNFGQGLNTQNGIFRLMPTTLQQGVVAVVVEEWRNGQKIGSIRKDMTLIVSQTIPSGLPLLSPPQVLGNGSLDTDGNLRICEGDTAGFSFYVYDTFSNPAFAKIHEDFSMPGLFIDTMSFGDSMYVELKVAADSVGLGCHEVVLVAYLDLCPITIPKLYRFNFCVDNATRGFTQDTLTTCAFPVTLPGFDGFNHQWFPTIGLNNIFLQNPTANPPGSLWYQLTTSCLTDSIYLENASAQAGFSINEPCRDTTMSVNVVDNSTGNPITWSYDMGDGSGPISTPSFGYTYSTSAPSVVVTQVVTNQAGCSDTTSVTLTFDEDCVWPGDADKNKLVDHLDIFPLGLHFGDSGVSRLSQGILFDPAPAGDWGDTISGGVDIKHADCDGSGRIDLADTLAINLNFGFSHLKAGIAKRRFDHAPLWVRLPQDSIFNRDTVSAKIQLGIDTLQVDSIYGLAFSFHYQRDLVDSSSIKVHFDQSVFGQKNQDMITIYRNFSDQGRIDIAVVGITGINRNGWGDVAAVKYVMQDDIAGKTDALITQELRHELSNVRAITYSEDEVTLDVFGDTTNAYQRVSSIGSINGSTIKIWPNPAQDRVHLLVETGVETINIFDLSGRQMISHRGYQNSSQYNLDVSKLAAGMYLLELRTSSGTYKTTLQKHQY